MLLPSLAFVAMVRAAAGQEEPACPVGGCAEERRNTAGSAAGWQNARDHHWPRARGHVGKYSHTSIVGPRNLTAAFAWSIGDPSGAINAGTALIDYQKNIITATMAGLERWTPGGALLWTYKAEGFYSHAVPSLVGDVVFGGGIPGVVFALDLQTGRELWRAQTGATQEMDTPYVECHGGVVLSAVHRPSFGNQRAVALNATDGSRLWEWTHDTALWNFYPMFPGDGSFVVMDIHGGLHKRGVAGGELRWHRPPPPSSAASFTDGGVILGPGGTLYSCSNVDSGNAHAPGVIRAVRHSDGELLWERLLPQPCVSWPASDGRVVVVPAGALPASMPYPTDRLPFVPQLFKLWLHRFSKWLGPQQYGLWRHETKPMHVLAFDADTGKMRWQFDIPAWPYYQSRGDEERFEERMVTWPHRPVCGPASWSAGTLGGDGTFYAGGMDGILYAINDRNGDGWIDTEGEVSTLDIGAASLHGGPSFAPGLMAYSSCAHLWVFAW